MSLVLRPFNREDAEACGLICYEAFKQIDEAHGFPPSFQSAEEATANLAARGEAGFYGVVAEDGGRIVGSNFMDVRSLVGGIGPISVDCDYQNGAIGRRLMEDAIAHATARGLAGMRLTQASFHNRSLSLYAKLGFVVREPLAVMHGPGLGITPHGYSVRSMVESDIDAASRLCVLVHGLERSSEVAAAVGRGSAQCVERNGRLTGYVTTFGGGHAVAETNADLQALISAQKQFTGRGFLMPSRNAALFKWCLDVGMRVVSPMTLMSMGLYSEPAGAFIPSYLY
jgi:predicted N-acetyltransferase YhbS